MDRWYAVEDYSMQDDIGNGPIGIAISKYPDDVVDAIAWMQEGSFDDALVMAASRELLSACKRVLNEAHDLHRDTLKVLYDAVALAEGKFDD